MGNSRTLWRVGVVTLATLLAARTPTHAWSSIGHMAVAYVAYQQLDQATKDRADALLKLNPDRKNWLALLPKNLPAKEKKMRIFMIASTWPDRIKRIKPNKKKHIVGYTDDTPDPDRPNGDATNKQNIGYGDHFKHKYWHFIDTPFTQDGTPLEPIPDPNAQERITTFRAAISSGASDDIKSYDLSWLLHLVGDVHQPLHAAARFSKGLPHGDAGGNLVKLTCKQPCPEKLHSFWDGVLGGEGFSGQAITVGKSLPAAGPDGDDLDVAHWIKESFDLAQSDVYKDPPIGAGGGPFKLTSQYKADAKTLARTRMALASARLAKILNTELK